MAQPPSREASRNQRSSHELSNHFKMGFAGRLHNYDKRDLRIACEQMDLKNVSSAVLPEDEKDRLKQKIAATPKEQLTQIVFRFPDLSKLRADVEAILSQTVVSEVIEELRNDRERAGWLEAGLSLHRSRRSQTCLFCGNELPQESLNRLEGHFNNHYAQFITNLNNKMEELMGEREKAERFRLPDKANLYDHLTSDYENAGCQFAKSISDACSNLAVMGTALANKRDVPFRALPLDHPPQHSEEDGIRKLNAIIERHNLESESFHSTISDARKTLEASLVAESFESYSARKTAVADLEAECRRMKNDRQAIQDQISALEREIREHQKPAEELTQDLWAYLGHKEISFEVKENGYTIVRNGESASALSEGEKSGIAFLYFLKCLNDKSFEASKGVVVIDDPVSSLDANSLFSAFACMKERTKGAGQLFVLTHNFSLFRQVKNWFQYVQKRKKLGRKVAFYQMVPKKIGDRRRATIELLDPLLLKYESEYHFLFKRLYDGAQDDKAPKGLEEYYPLPNIARRLLESFLAFRRPSNTGEFFQQLEATTVDGATKTRIIRFLHNFSHLDRLVAPEHDISALSETRQVLQDVLNLIQTEDPSHYREMLSVIGV